MPVKQDRRFMNQAMTGSRTCPPSMAASNRPQASLVLLSPFKIIASARSGSWVSAWRNSKTSPLASLAPAFIWLDRPRAERTSASTSPSVKAQVSSKLPPSAIMTSCPRCRKACKPCNSRVIRVASLRVGTMMEMRNKGFSVVPVCSSSADWGFTSGHRP